MRMTQKTALRTCLIACLLLAALAAHAAELPIQALASNPAAFDGQTVTLRGTAAAVRETISRRGNPYTIFKVLDASRYAVKVFTWGHPGIKSGDWVEVIGVFQQIRRVGRYTFYNEVDAHSVRLLAR